MGEYVKSASSTVEAPVVRRLNEEHGEALRKQGEKKAAKKAPAEKAPAADAAESGTAADAAKSGTAAAAAESGAATTAEPPAPDDAAPAGAEKPEVGEAPAGEPQPEVVVEERTAAA